MNTRYVLNVLGVVLLVLAAAQLILLTWCLILGDTAATNGFAAGTIVAATFGAAMRLPLTVMRHS